MRSLVAALALTCGWAISAAAQNGGQDAEATFRQGLTALHNFEYEDANEAFALAHQIDPGFVLAYWGEAMTYHQTLWRREDVETARKVLSQLGPSAEARAAKAKTPRAKGLLSAIEELFGAGDASARRQRYATAMGRLHASLPDDDDVGALYGLALMGTTARGLIGGSEAPEGFGRALAGSAIQAEAANVFNGILARNPVHPGALHYLLHDYDDPDHARLALDAARRYATVAQGSSHALHMPAHIFVQLGMWRDAEQSDFAAFDASRKWAARKQLGPAMHNFHAWSWRQYELLQLGRYEAARQAMQELEPVVRTEREAAPHGAHQPLLADLSSMRARYVIETRRWDLLAREQNFGNVDELFAIGLSAARTGNMKLAEIARSALAARARSEQEGDLRPAIAIMEREIAGIVMLASEQKVEAVNTLTAAAQAELNLPAPFGLPSPPKPAPELLGEVLIEVGRPQEADAWFERALQRNANRSLSVLGRARAAAASGKPAAARSYYEALLANYANADADLGELNEARAALTTPSADGQRARWVPWFVAGAVLTPAVFWWARTRSSTRSRKPATKPRGHKRN